MLRSWEWCDGRAAVCFQGVKRQFPNSICWEGFHLVALGNRTELPLRFPVRHEKGEKKSNFDKLKWSGNVFSLAVLLIVFVSPDGRIEMWLVYNYMRA